MRILSRLSLTLSLCLTIAACSGANTGLHNIQFSGAAEAFPADYQVRARRYLGAEAGLTVAVSYPRLTLGETALSPKRWYVCLRGLEPTGSAPDGFRPVLEIAENMMSAQSRPGTYDVVLVLRASGTSTAIKGYDSPLCREGRYEVLAAA
ncbi:hypothetical protein KD146_00205 [Devosia sp. BSSL-BM10]|uniref:Lipoprotein n=1 Tax=Devosia litorisediminis TaxID=2829817 RepID=A0A942ICF7_9HYPH|nr:hypothetical protein [Devosia litorisediminis]MBS3847105.1 hypothetical protein [Devosia litorisediminis]